MNDFFEEFTMVCLSFLGAMFTFKLLQVLSFAKGGLLSKVIAQFIKGIV